MRKLKICHISDSHGKHKDLEVPESDVLICSGDISMMGYKHEVESFFSWFKRQPSEYKILVAGNHDLTFDPQRGGNNGNKPQWLWDMIIDYRNDDSNFYLENNGCQINGVKFWGSPTSAWFCGDRWAFNVREPEAEALYSTIPLGTDVVITHGPPFGQGDHCLDVSRGVGDTRLTYHIRRVKPLLHLFGHIHESYGYSELRGTHYFNGCNCDLDYEIHNEPWLMDVDFDEKEVEILNT